MSKVFDIEKCISQLKERRKIFHSEADFQFALAWEIQNLYQYANIRLEYSPKEFSEWHIDIIVYIDNKCIPIELKYKTASYEFTPPKDNFHIGHETYKLKTHGAQNLGNYDFVKDVERLEKLSTALPEYYKGYAIWLTNDKAYKKPPSKSGTQYEQFSVHENSVKTGEMEWLLNPSDGTIKGREKNITLKDKYKINWKQYSLIGDNNGEFYYCVVPVKKLLSDT